jgi:ribosome-binding protein aMBF1 (putative translation factor)
MIGRFVDNLQPTYIGKSHLPVKVKPTIGPSLSKEVKLELAETEEVVHVKTRLMSKTLVKDVIRKRQKDNLSQSDLAKRLNVKHKLLVDFETGKMLYDSKLTAQLKQFLSD